MWNLLLLLLSLRVFVEYGGINAIYRLLSLEILLILYISFHLNFTQFFNFLVVDKQVVAVQWVCSCFLFSKRSGKRTLKVNESISCLTFFCFEIEFLNLSILGEVLMKLLLSSGRREVFDVKTFLILLYVFLLFSQYLLIPFFLRKCFLDVDLMSFIGSSMFLFNCVESPL